MPDGNVAWEIDRRIDTQFALFFKNFPKIVHPVSEIKEKGWTIE